MDSPSTDRLEHSPSTSRFLEMLLTCLKPLQCTCMFSRLSPCLQTGEQRIPNLPRLHTSLYAFWTGIDVAWVFAEVM